MKLSLSKLPLYLILGTVVSMLALSSCGDKKGDPPVIPPTESFVMDFNYLETDTTNKRGKNDFSYYAASVDSNDTTRLNWVYSTVNVVVWNVVLTVNLIIPTAAYLESFNHEAVWDKKKKVWIWSYSFTAGLNNYTAALHGKIVGGNAEWEMHISQDGGFQDVIWFTGTSAVDGSGGSWTLNRNANAPEQYLSIDWNLYADGTADIQYTNIVPNALDNGAYIKFGTATSDPDFDRFYTIFNKGLNNTTEIMWKYLDNNGQVKDPNHYGNSDWHCWDMDLYDRVCQ